VRFIGQLTDQKSAFADLGSAFAEYPFNEFEEWPRFAVEKEDLMSADVLNTKPCKGWGMEGAVARWYAALTKKSLEDFRALARRVAKQILPQSRVLEVAPGPGYCAIELAKLGDYQITGLDISETFVEIACANAAKANVRIDFRRGNASGMPFDNDTFDFLLCRAAFKNFSEPQRALEEMYRVLRPGGQALIIDLRRDAAKESINQAITDMNLSVINGIITKLTFRFMLLKRAYTKGEFEELISQTKFRHVEIREDLIGLEILLSKDRATFWGAPHSVAVLPRET
jgi:ubiquinone/menaquinone biosynthesis C-methylase UbiE